MSKEIKKFDKNDNLVYYKDSNNYEYWYEFDERDKLIHIKDSNGNEHWYKYNENNNLLIHYKDTYGSEY